MKKFCKVLKIKVFFSFFYTLPKDEMCFILCRSPAPVGPLLPKTVSVHASCLSYYF